MTTRAKYAGDPTGKGMNEMLNTTYDAGLIVTASDRCRVCKLDERPCWSVRGRPTCASCVVKACTANAGDAVRFGGRANRPAAAHNRAA